jgi:serine protease inhibitor
MRILIFLILAYLSICQTTDNNQQVDLFKNLHTATKGNLLISPYSIYIALALAANGAAGDTRKDMIKVISPANPTIQSVNSYSDNLLAKKNYKTQIELANGIFTKVKPTKEFNAIATRYHATAQKLLSARQINIWVAQKTHGKIREVVDTLSPDTKLLLVSALYFSSRWKIEFEGDTMRNFHTRSLGVVKKQFMFNSFDSTGYYEDQTVRAVKVELQDNYFFHIIMPNDFDSFINNLTQTNLNTLLNPSGEKGVKLHMPEFTFDSSSDLKTALNNLGMKLPFTNDADFSNISAREQLMIEGVLHKTYIKVNKTGVEASAATVVTFEPTAAQPSEDIVEFVVDRPFIFVIKEQSEDELMLFLGKVENP